MTGRVINGLNTLLVLIVGFSLKRKPNPFKDSASDYTMKPIKDSVSMPNLKSSIYTNRVECLKFPCSTMK